MSVLRSYQQALLREITACHLLSAELKTLTCRVLFLSCVLLLHAAEEPTLSKPSGAPECPLPQQQHRARLCCPRCCLNFLPEGSGRPHRQALQPPLQLDFPPNVPGATTEDKSWLDNFPEDKTAQQGWDYRPHEVTDLTLTTHEHLPKKVMRGCSIILARSGC